jgi:hypothetical protein
MRMKPQKETTGRHLDPTVTDFSQVTDFSWNIGAYVNFEGVSYEYGNVGPTYTGPRTLLDYAGFARDDPFLYLTSSDTNE